MSVLRYHMGYGSCNKRAATIVAYFVTLDFICIIASNATMACPVCPRVAYAILGTRVIGTSLECLVLDPCWFVHVLSLPIVCLIRACALRFGSPCGRYLACEPALLVMCLLYSAPNDRW